MDRSLANDGTSAAGDLLTTILDSTAEGICGLDAEGNVAFLNASAEALLRGTRGSLIGRPFHALVHGTNRACAGLAGGCAFENARARGEAVHRENDAFARLDGTTLQVEMIVSPLRGSAQGSTGAVVTFRDVSERNRLRTQLAQAQKLESIGQLAAGIAHEINTPTQYIGDNTRFVRDSLEELCALLFETRDAVARAVDANEAFDAKALSKRFAQLDLDYLLRELPLALDQSLEGIGQVARIVRSMKEFAHPGADTAALADLNKAIESTTVVARNEWKYVAELELDLDPHLPPVPCIVGSINQVVLNLIVNAAHAIKSKLDGDAKAIEGSTKHGKIVVATRRDGDAVRIDVRDSGTGIPEAYRSRVFDPFFTTKPVGQGTGQGLALAHTVVVDKHGGTIGFDTELGVGTTFHVRLPLVPKQAPTA